MGQLGLGHQSPSVPSPTKVNLNQAFCNWTQHILYLSIAAFCCQYWTMKLFTSRKIICDLQISYKGPPIRKVACGADFSFIVDIKGHAYSFGCPEYGQLGKFWLILKLYLLVKLLQRQILLLGGGGVIHILEVIYPWCINHLLIIILWTDWLFQAQICAWGHSLASISA